jgi:hypothetical protein
MLAPQISVCGVWIAKQMMQLLYASHACTDGHTTGRVFRIETKGKPQCVSRATRDFFQRITRESTGQMTDLFLFFLL